VQQIQQKRNNKGTSKKQNHNLEFRVIDNFASLCEILPDWKNLYYTSGNNVFINPDFYVAWWKNIGHKSNYKWRVFMAYDKGKLVAIAPMVIRSRLGLKVIQWAGGELFDYNEVLAESAQYCEVIWSYILNYSGYNVALFKDIIQNSTCDKELQKIATPSLYEQAYFIKLDYKNSGEWFESVSGNLRKEYSRYNKKLSSKGRVGYKVHNDAEDIKKVISCLIDQKRKWYLKKNLQGVFDYKGIEDFLNEIARISLTDKTLHVSSVTCGDEIIAAHIGFIKNSTVLWYMTSYDIEWSEYSPGRILLYEGIKWAIDNNIKEFDFLRGNAGYKRSITDSKKLLPKYVIPRGIIGKAARLIYKMNKYCLTL